MTTAKKNKRPSHFDVLTFDVDCPSCGATVEFASAGSVMSVCDYCQTTVVREGKAIKSQGKQSLTIEDYSPLQIGSCGVYHQHEFAVIGRIQLQYEDGVWNEWYIQFDNGRNAWLSEALGQYSLTLNKGIQPDLPRYGELLVNHDFYFSDNCYTVTDKRSAKAIAGEGELPFVVGKGWQTWVIDGRCEQQFITLDYGQSGIDGDPAVFEGVAVDLDNLKLTLLRENEQIKQSQKTDKTSIDKLDCPNCGSAVPYIAGATNCLLCPSCHSEIKLLGDKAEVLKLHSMMQSYDTSLSLGDKARIPQGYLAEVSDLSSDNLSLADGQKTHDYVVIGIMRLNEVGEYAQWTEYLLYSFSDGFLWLSEESTGWYISRVLNELPKKKGRHLDYRGKLWRKEYDESYQNRVLFAIGAFNWQVNVDDAMTLTDYRCAQQTITAEQDASEITYTISSPVPTAVINVWFGKQLSDHYRAKNITPKKRGISPIFFIIIFIALFIIISTMTEGGGVIVSSGGYYPNSSSSHSSGSSGRTGYTSFGSHK